MKSYTVLGFNEKGQAKFTRAKERLFLYIADLPNNNDFIIVRGFRGKFSFGDEIIERREDMRELTETEVANFFNDPFTGYGDNCG